MKNLITYLSKKSLSLGNGPALDRRWTGHESGSFLSILTLFLMLFSFGVGNAWGESWTWTAAAGDNQQFGADASGITDGAKFGTATLNGKKWEFERDGLFAAKTSNSSVDYLQIGKSSNAENVVLSSRAFNGTITQIDVNCSSASGKHTCKIEVGGTEVLSATNTATWTTASTLTTGTISKQGEIVITFSKSAGAAALYIHSITVTYTPATYNVDWYIGETKEKSETSVATGTPPTVADNALGGDCSSLKFLGWSETNIGSTPDDAPDDLFQPDNLPGLTKNTTYYAVFGDLDYDTDDSILIQTHKYDSWTYSGTTSDGSSYRLFANGAYVSSTAFRLEGLATVIICGGTYGGSSYNGIFVKDENGTSLMTGTVSTSTKTTAYKLVNKSSLSGRKSIRIGSSSGNGTSTGVGLTCARIFSYVPEYSNCVTTCAPSCDELGAVNGDVTLTKTAFTITATWPKTSGDNETGYSVQLYDNNGTGVKGSKIGDPVTITGKADGDRTCTFGAKTPVGSRLTANHEYFVGVTPTYSGDGGYCETGTEVSNNVTTDPVYTVTYAGGSGSEGTMTDSNSPYEAGDEVTVMANTFTKCGYTFDAWSYSPAQTVSDGKFTMGTANVTITATWTSLQDTYYDYMHEHTAVGKTYYATRSGKYTAPAALSDETPDDGCEGEHYKFMGWVNKEYINDDGTLKAGYVIVSAGATNQCATGATFHAVWATEE